MKTKNKTAVKKSVKSSRKVVKSAAPSRGRGRPSIPVNLARKGNFSIDSLHRQLKGKLTKAALGNKIKAALAAHTIKIVERRRTSEKGAYTRIFAAVLRKPRVAAAKTAAPEMSVAIAAA